MIMATDVKYKIQCSVWIKGITDILYFYFLSITSVRTSTQMQYSIYVPGVHKNFLTVIRIDKTTIYFIRNDEP